MFSRPVGVLMLHFSKKQRHSATDSYIRNERERQAHFSPGLEESEEYKHNHQRETNTPANTYLYTNWATTALYFEGAAEVCLLYQTMGI